MSRNAPSQKTAAEETTVCVLPWRIYCGWETTAKIPRPLEPDSVLVACESSRRPLLPARVPSGYSF